MEDGLCTIKDLADAIQIIGEDIGRPGAIDEKLSGAICRIAREIYNSR
jgi:hypothetical protein